MPGSMWQRVKRALGKIPGVLFLYRVIKYHRHLTPSVFHLSSRFNRESLLIGDRFDTESMNGSELRRQIVSRLHAGIDFENIVETGTFLGNTTRFFAELATSGSVITIESNDRFHAFALWRQDLAGVRRLKGSSDDMLRVIDGEISRQRNFVYLDAHWDAHLPLRGELELVLRWPACVIMIDDFKVEGDPGFGFDTTPDGHDLGLDYVRDLTTDAHLFFPGFAASEDDGLRQGFIVMTNSEEYADVLRTDPLLRPAG